MITPDVNLLLYAYDSASPSHKRASTWWTECLSGEEPVGLAPSVIFGFVRIGTNPRAFINPFTPTEAAEYVRSWLSQPQVEILAQKAQHITDVLTLIEELGTAGNLVSDAQLAALAIEYDAVLHTADTDFIRFPNLKWFNPLTGAKSRNPPKRTK
jgi:uncharacterized protein